MNANEMQYLQCQGVQGALSVLTHNCSQAATAMDAIRTHPTWGKKFPEVVADLLGKGISPEGIGRHWELVGEDVDEFCQRPIL